MFQINENYNKLKQSYLFAEIAREFDTLKFKKVPQSLETGLFFVNFFALLYSNI